MSIAFFNLCMNNKLEEAKQLWDTGVDLGFTDPGKRTALSMSAGRGHIDVVDWLISIDSPIETKDNDGRTALARAAVMDHTVVIDALLDADADINAFNKDNRSVLSDAIANKKEEAAALLIDRGAELNSTDCFGKTALHHAVQNGLINIVTLLVDDGATIICRDNYNCTPADYAIKSNRMDILRILTEAVQEQAVNTLSTDENAESAGTETEPLVEQETASFKAYMLSSNVQPTGIGNAAKTDSIKDLKTAVEENEVEWVRYYIEQGENVNQIFYDFLNRHKKPLFTTAIMKGNLEVIALLIEAGVDINERFYDDKSLFQEVTKMLESSDINTIRYKDNELYKMAEEAYSQDGMDFNERLHEKNGLYETDYMIEAIDYRKTQIIKMLFEAGFDTTDIPLAEGRVYRNCYYVSKMISTYCFHQKYDEAYELLPLFLEADFIMDLDSLRELSSNRVEGYQQRYYGMILEKCLDINETDTSGRTILHNALNDFRNTFQFQQTPVKPEENRDDIFIDALLDCEGIDVNINDYSDNPPLYYACKYTTGRIVRKLLQMGADVHALCGSKSIPLTQVACEAKKMDVLTVLCDFGADVNAGNDKGFTLLHTACLEQEMSFITYLLEKGADVTSSDHNGDTPLHILVRQNKPNTLKIIDLLLTYGANLEAHNSAMRSPFFVCCCTMDSQFKCKNLPVLKHLLSLGAVVDSQDINDASALHHAVEYDEMNLVKFLLTNGADSHIENNKGVSPYKLALSKNRRAIISMIEKAGVSIFMDGDDMDAAFMRACKNGQRGVAEMLVKSGNIDITYVDDAGRTPLHYIAKMGMTALAKFAIDQAVDINYQDNTGQTALHFAAGHQQKEVFKLLVDNGADLNIADNDGLLPIHLITNRGQHDLLALLLKNGADTGIMTNSGQSLLHMACYTRARKCVRLLLEQGMNPNILDQAGAAPLVISVNINQKEIAKMLLTAGADIKIKDLDGDEPVHISVIRGFKDMLALLLDEGGDINALNNSGLAPLHLAAYHGFKDIFKYLLDNGADFSIKTGAGKSCIDIAAENGQKELIELIGIIQKRRH